MTTTTNQRPAALSSGIRAPYAALRFLIAGAVLLGVTVMNLFVVVQDWSSATSSGFVSDHGMQLAGMVFGVVLMVTGIVKYVRR